MRRSRCLSHHLLISHLFSVHSSFQPGTLHSQPIAVVEGSTWFEYLSHQVNQVIHACKRHSCHALSHGLSVAWFGLWLGNNILHIKLKLMHPRFLFTGRRVLPVVECAQCHCVIRSQTYSCMRNTLNLMQNE